MGGRALIRNPNPIAKLLWNLKEHSRIAKNSFSYIPKDSFTYCYMLRELPNMLVHARTHEKLSTHV